MYEVYLKYDVTMPIGIKGYWGDLCPHTFADIKYWTEETDDEINDDEDEGYFSRYRNKRLGEEVLKGFIQ